MSEDGRSRSLQELANAQWAVVRADQMHGIGFSDQEIHRLAHRSLIHRRFRGIYTYATTRPIPKGVLLAAQWSCGMDAYLTGRTALALAKVRVLHLGQIEVAVPRRTARAHQRPVHLQRTEDPPPRLRTDGWLRFTPVERALLDLAAQGARETELNKLITDAIHLRRLDHRTMRALIDTHAGHRGIITLATAYAAYLPKPDGKHALEVSFDRGLATRPWIPQPEPNQYLEVAGVRWELDRLWPEYGLLVELHGGGYHHAKEDLEKDSFKAAKLALAGIQTFVITDTRWELEPECCLDDLEAMLAQRGWRGRQAA